MVGGLFQIVMRGYYEEKLRLNHLNTFSISINGKHENSFFRGGNTDFYKTCYNTMSIRKYKNFEIIFHDITIGNELYNSSKLWYIYPLNLYCLNQKPLLVNNKKIIKLNLQRETLLNKTLLNIQRETLLNKRKRIEIEEKNDNTVIKRNYSFRSEAADKRAQRNVQNKEIKHKMRKCY